MKEILAATAPVSITVEVTAKCVTIYSGSVHIHTVYVGDSVDFKAASFTKVPVSDEVYWTVRAAEALGGNF